MYVVQGKDEKWMSCDGWAPHDPEYGGVLESSTAVPVRYVYGMYRYSCTENSSIEICLQNEKWAVINYIPLRFRASSLYVSPDDLTAFCARMEQIQTELGPIERKNGTNRLQITSVSHMQIWVIN